MSQVDYKQLKSVPTIFPDLAVQAVTQTVLTNYSLMISRRYTLPAGVTLTLQGSMSIL